MVAALKEKHEREKILLTQKNRKMTAETEKVRVRSLYQTLWSWLVLVLVPHSLVSSAVLLCGQTHGSEPSAGG